jgi:hypothetical protein
MVVTKPGVPSNGKGGEENGVYYSLPRGTVKIIGTWNPNTGLWDLTAVSVLGADPEAGTFYTERNVNFFFDDDLTIAIDPTTDLLMTGNGTTTDQSVNGIGTLAAAASAAFTLPASFAGGAFKAAAAAVTTSTATSEATVSSQEIKSLSQNTNYEYFKYVQQLEANCINIVNQSKPNQIAINSLTKGWTQGHELSSDQYNRLNHVLPKFEKNFEDFTNAWSPLVAAAQTNFIVLTNRPELWRPFLRLASNYDRMYISRSVGFRSATSYRVAAKENMWAQKGQLDETCINSIEDDFASISPLLYANLTPLESQHILFLLQRTQDSWETNSADVNAIQSLEWNDVRASALFPLYESLLDPFATNQIDNSGVVYHTAYLVSPVTAVNSKPTYARFDMILKPATHPAFKPQPFPGGQFFVDSDIIDLTNLVYSLSHNRDLLSQYLYSTLTARPNVLNLLELYKTDETSRYELRTNIIGVLNETVSGDSIYHSLKGLSSDSHFHLHRRTKQLLDADPQSGPDLRLLNHWLINDALSKGDGLARPEANGLLVRDPIIYVLTIYGHIWVSGSSSQSISNTWTYTYTKNVSWDNANSTRRTYLALYQGILLPDVNHTHVLELQREPLAQTSTKISLSEGMVESREDTHQSVFNSIASIPKDLITAIVPIGGGSGQSAGGSGGSSGGSNLPSGSSPGGGANAASSGAGTGGGGGTAPSSPSPPIQ